jgi:hypothetical protein
LPSWLADETRFRFFNAAARNEALGLDNDRDLIVVAIAEPGVELMQR